MFAPYWMMQNLLIDEGDEVYVTSALNVPKGLYCRMQPHTTEFLDVVANVGPKVRLVCCENTKKEGLLSCFLLPRFIF